MIKSFEQFVNENYNDSASDIYKHPFDINVFKSLTYDEKIEYCKNNQKIKYFYSSVFPKNKDSKERIDSRIVWKIDDTKVLKIAINEKGLEQNKIEAQISNNANNKSYPCSPDMFAKVYDYDENGEWIIMQLTKHINNEYMRNFVESECKKIIGYDWKTVKKFIDYTTNLYKYIRFETCTKDDEKLFESDEFRNNKWFENLYDYMTNFQVEQIDIKLLSSWGILKNKDGKETLVLKEYWFGRE